jgi:endoglucanase
VDPASGSRRGPTSRAAAGATRRGNLAIAAVAEPRTQARPGYSDSDHMDRPGFVVERIVAPDVVELSFRGGVMDEMLVDAAGGDPRRVRRATPRGISSAIRGGAASAAGSRRYMAELRPPDRLGGRGRRGDVGRGPGRSDRRAGAHAGVRRSGGAGGGGGGVRHAAVDQLTQPVRLLFTRAEEIGFVGAIGACRSKTLPANGRVIGSRTAAALQARSAGDRSCGWATG